MRNLLRLVAGISVAMLATPAWAEPGPCQEKDIKAKAACLDVWVNRLKAENAQPLPRGTVIAWRPSFEEIDKAAGTIQIPKGWAVCDLQASMTPGSAYLKGVGIKEYVESFDPKDPGGKGFFGGQASHQHAVDIPERAVQTRDDLTYGEGDRTHAANTLHSHTGSTSPAPNDPPFVRVILLCSKGDQAIANWTSYGYGGDRITIARRGLGFSEVIERSYAVCNTGAAAMTIAFRPLPSAANAAGVNEDDKLEPGECAGFDRPTWIRATSVGGNNTVSGIYYALRPGTFPKEGVKFRREEAQARTAAAPRLGVRDLGEGKAECKPLPATSPLRKQYYSSCRITLPEKANYRLCFPANFVDQPDGNYAYGALRLIVDSSLLAKGLPQIGPDVRSAVPPGGCIDLWSTGEAIVLIAPPEFAHPWDPTKIKTVRVSIQEMIAAK